MSDPRSTTSDAPADGEIDADDDTDKETSRIEAFSDGVFAIAITLLIIEIKVPVVDHGLAAALAQQWHHWIGYLAGFAIIGIMWVNHHRLFTMIQRSDERLLLYNTVLLLAVSIVPFPTAVIATYLDTPEARTAAILYNLHGLFIAVAYTLLFRHAVLGGALLRRDVPRQMVEDIARQYRFGPLLYLVCIAVAFASPYAAIALNVALGIYFGMPPAGVRAYMERHRARHARRKERRARRG